MGQFLILNGVNGEATKIIRSVVGKIPLIMEGVSTEVYYQDGINAVLLFLAESNSYTNGSR